MVRNEKGFTMIELVVVIVILGILAAVAVPKFADMKTEAEVAAADGVYGAAQGAAALNFAAGLAGATQPAGAPISTGAHLNTAMDGGLPDGWVAVGTDICLDATLPANDCTGETYVIDVATAESQVAPRAKAELGKSW